MLVCCEKPIQMSQLVAPFPHKKMGDHILLEPCQTFPDAAVFISAVGHILELYNPGDYDESLKSWDIKDLPIVPKPFKLKVIPSKLRSLQTFRKFLKDPSIKEIINAGDSAMEGQLLIDEILYYLGNKKPVKRLWTSSLTKNGVETAFKSMRSNKEYHHLYQAGIARQRADWLIGINTTRALTTLMAEKGLNLTMNAGRVQTSLMGVIYQRELEIETFKSEPYWDFYITTQFKNGTMKAKWFNEKESHIFNKEAALLVRDVCKDKNPQVYSIEEKEHMVKPPQLFSLSTLQSKANQLYKFSSDRVLKLLQSLYEKWKLVSYPRTDSCYLTAEEAATLPNILRNISELADYKPLLYGAKKDITDDKRYVDSSKVSDHFALLPTEDVSNYSLISSEERLIYDLIVKSVIAAHYPDHLYQSREMILSIDDQFTFKANGKVITQNGWKQLYNKSLDEQEDSEPEMEMLPLVHEEETGILLSHSLEEGFTKPKPRFTDGDLIKIMSNAGNWVREKEDFKNKELVLGTAATRHEIINKVKDKYISVQDNQVYLLPAGRVLIEALGENSYLTSVLTTGRMERYLDDIKNGKASVDDFLKRTEKMSVIVLNELKEKSKTWNFSEQLMQDIGPKEIGRCLSCGGILMERDKFYGCSNYSANNCTFSIPKQKAGVTITKANIEKLLITGTTSLIKGFKKKGKDGTFNAYLVWDSIKQNIVYKFQ